MIIHYLKIALRKLGKNYVFASINIGGLVIALASAFLIFHFVLNELSTDHFHKNKDDIYRTIIWLDDDGEKMPLKASSYIMAPNIIGKFPELKDATRAHSMDHYYGGQLILMGEEKIKAENFIVADPNFFNIFTINLAIGNKQNLLKDLNSLVISEKMAAKYFPDENPIGKTLRVKNIKELRTYSVTGVFKDLPINSTIKAEFIGNIELSKDYYTTRGWWISGTDTYIQLKKGSDPSLFTEKLNEFAKVTHPDRVYTYTMQKLTDVYFDSGYLQYYNDPQGNYKLIITYALIGIIILIIASINYIIITTASSSERMIEIGMRKVMGAKRLTIIKQMLSESLLITFIALPLAIIVSEFALPTFNNLLGKELEINYFENWFYLAGIFVITLFISIISGSYISVFVSKFTPEQIFKKRFSRRQYRFNFKKVLITIQIIAFMVLFGFSSIIIKQIDYMLTKDIGFTSKHLVTIKPPHDHSLFSCKVYVDELLKNPNIESASEVYVGIYSDVYHELAMSTEEHPDDNVDLKLLAADYEYLKTMNFKLIEGRAFDKNLSSDSTSIILNESAAQILKLENPIDKIVIDGATNRLKVIGIVSDFHFESMHKSIPPMGIVIGGKNKMVCQIMLRVNPHNYTETIKYMEDKWETYGPKGQFQYDFFDNILQDEYKDDSNFSDTIKILTILTVLIAGFGIFGFSFYNARQKIKEIGIRKVYGASVRDIIKMIYKELGVLILSSTIIALPLTYLICDQWMQNYAYRIDFPYWVFAMVIVISIAIVFITTGITAYNAANKNPVDSLRYE